MRTAIELLITYALHSTILLSATWLVAQALRHRADVRDVMWKLALVVPLATAAIQVGGGITPLTGELALEDATPSPSPTPTPELRLETELEPSPALVTVAPLRPEVRGFAFSIDDETSFAFAVPAPVAAVPLDRLDLAAPAPTVASALAAAPTAADPTPRPWWPRLLVGAWLLGAAFLLLRLGMIARRLRRTLARRRDMLDDPALESFLVLAQRAKIQRRLRLTECPGIDAPMALGRTEVVLTPGLQDRLDPTQVRMVLGHELGHLQRRDSWWFAFAAVLECVLFFQPLNRLARRGLRDAAEELCDDFAIALVGRPEALAQALATVASWQLDREQAMLVAGAVHGGRPLVRRVERMLEPGRPLEYTATGPWRAGLSATCVGLLAVFGPGAVWAHPHGEDGDTDPEIVVEVEHEPSPHEATTIIRSDGHGGGTIIVRDGDEEVVITSTDGGSVTTRSKRSKRDRRSKRTKRTKRTRRGERSEREVTAHGTTIHVRDGDEEVIIMAPSGSVHVPEIHVPQVHVVTPPVPPTPPAPPAAPEPPVVFMPKGSAATPTVIVDGEVLDLEALIEAEVEAELARELARVDPEQARKHAAKARKHAAKARKHAAKIRKQAAKERAAVEAELEREAEELEREREELEREHEERQREAEERQREAEERQREAEKHRR